MRQLIPVSIARHIARTKAQVVAELRAEKSALLAAGVTTVGVIDGHLVPLFDAGAERLREIRRMIAELEAA